MMLFKLSVSNIKKSLRDYAIYFITLIIGVAIFYVFNAIGEQSAFMNISENRNDIIALLTTALSGVSVFVSLILGLLIVYASRFLMKRRNKEFALYLILGMGKGRISMILFIETLIIGIGSLGVGLIIGIGLSQIMSSLVANLFEADMTEYKFIISEDAIIKTIIYFGIMYIVVMIFNSFIISRCRLINLIQSGKKSEKMKLKNPALCVIVFIVSSLALGYAYYTVGWNVINITANKILISIVIGAVSTFLIFWSVSGMMLRVVMSMKKAYYKGLNSFTFRQISSKINTAVMSMTVICLMLFVTICTLASAFSIRNSMNYNLNTLCPVDFELMWYEHNGNAPQHVNIIEKLNKYNFDIEESFKESVHFHDYRDENFTLRESFGEHFEEIQSDLPLMEYDVPEKFIKLSDYNNLMELYGRDKLTLNNNEFVLICDFNYIKAIRNSTLEKGREINIFGNKLYSKYAECRDDFIDISAQHMNTGVYIIPDNAVDESYAGADYFIGNYNAETKEDKILTEKYIFDKQHEFFKEYSKENSENHHGNSYNYRLDTRLDIAESTIGLGAIVTFIGLYIGLIFLISCAVILALKQLSESVDSMPRYEMLRKIGAEESDISKSLFMQTGLFFLLPMMLAGIHSIFGMKFAVFILEIFGTEKMTESIFSTLLIILIIYGGYFFITYICSKSIIKNHKQ